MENLNDILNPKSYKDVPGWLNDAEHIFEEIINESQNGDIVAEIGTLLGQSSCRMASLIRESSKNIKFYSIPHNLNTLSKFLSITCSKYACDVSSLLGAKCPDNIIKCHNGSNLL